jgi:hypothetical protein
MIVKRWFAKDAPIPIRYWSVSSGIGLGFGRYWYYHIWTSEDEKAQHENFDKPNIDSDSLTAKLFSQVL